MNQEVRWEEWRHSRIREYDQSWLTVDTITIKLEAGIVKDEVDATASLLAELLGGIPKPGHVVPEDVLFGGGEVVTTSGLQFLDIIFRHVDEKREICGVPPEADLSELMEDKPLRLELFRWGEVIADRPRLGETGGEFEDGLRGA